MIKNKSILRWFIFSALLITAGDLLYSPAVAEEVLRFSSSAQVHEAFGMEGLNIFTAESDVKVDLFIGSSDAAVYRLMNGFADIASTTERLQFSHQDYGYVETPFCKAPLVVISNAKTPVRNISSEQLRAIFDGTITNWEEVGGPDQEIVVVIPERNTGAYKNFRQLALKRFDVKYDFMTYRSTNVVKLVTHIPWSISFTTQGAHTVNEAVKIIQIDGKTPGDPTYPYYQIFSFVTKGQPVGAAKKLIDFTFSEKGRSVMKKNGMEPIDN